MRVILSNYATFFPGLFTPYVEGEERSVYWECEACGERADEVVREGVIPEKVLSCACRENHSFSMETDAEIHAAAQAVPLSQLTEAQS